MKLSLGLGDGLSLLHPGRGRAWWWTDQGPAWSDGDRLWAAVADGLVVVPLPGEPDEAEPVPGGLVAWNPAGEVVHVGAAGAVSQLHGPPDDPSAVVRVRNGADSRAIRRAGAWSLQCAGADVPLPEGAVRARDLRPFRRGEGACWKSGGWLYRMAHRGSLRAVAELGGGFAVGPLGAVVFGEGEWTGGAAPDRSARRFETPLVATEWGLRWGAAGSCVGGVDGDGAATWIDLETGSVTHRVPRALPLDGTGRALGRDGAWHGVDLPWRPIEATCARYDHLLAGPGGRVWDLRTGACTRRPVIALGATVGTAAGFATVAWDTGLGHWVTADGRVRDRFHVPLRPGDVISEGWRHGERAVFETAEGRQFLVGGGAVEAVAERVPAPRQAEEPGVEGLPVRRSAEVGGRTWGWSDDGLLVAL